MDLVLVAKTEAGAETAVEAAAACSPIWQQHVRCGWASSMTELAMLGGLQGGGAKAEAAAWIQAWRDSQSQAGQPVHSALPAAQTAAGAGPPPSQQTAAGASHFDNEWQHGQSQMLGQAEQESVGSGQGLLQPYAGSAVGTQDVPGRTGALHFPVLLLSERKKCNSVPVLCLRL